MFLRTALSVIFLVVLAPAAVAQKPADPPSTPPSVDGLLRCRALGEASARLDCFDKAVADFERARASGDLVTVDRQQVRKARRSLFGLTLPDLGLFGDNAIGEGNADLETTITRVSQDPTGHWILDVAEGGRWLQLDSRELVVDPRPGHVIRIRRAAMGSYLANVNRQTAIRVQRVR